MTEIPDDLGFIVLLFVLFVIPKALQRYRVPAAITSLILGALAANLGWVEENLALRLMSTFGIVALFLFAVGMVEVLGPRLAEDVVEEAIRLVAHRSSRPARPARQDVESHR